MDCYLINFMNIRQKIISLFVTVSIPKFQFLLQVTKILQKTNIALNFAIFTVSDNVYNFDTEIHRCIGALIRNENYANALELSNLAELDSSEIILAQVQLIFLIQVFILCYLIINIFSIEVNLSIIYTKMIKLKIIFGMNVH